ncbi:efflux transporter outer membrane subunit [Salinisphaera sp. USBA-960]|nr:efflux transporter outer membrane subunit [Salifodinibacter halophilus]NNC26487.1 efflux transporter outer membrane subunit [Salifodinibacter halophilus]
MNKLAVLGLAALVGLAGCTLGPDYKRPSVDMPSSKFASTHLSQKQRKALASWWEKFGDAKLNHMINEALDRNLKIAKQVQVVRQERAALGMANADLFPTVSGQADAARQEVSRNSASGASSADRRSDQFSVSGTLDYEVDLFGRLRRSRQAARAQLLSSAYTQDSIRLTVIADVVTNYLTLRSLQRQIRVTQDTIETRKKGLSLDKKRYKYGAINKLTLLQTRSLLQSARAQLPPLKKQVGKQKTALAILTGKTPRQIMNHMEVADGKFSQIKVPELPKAIPSLVVDRRPDIRAAEAKLIAANADVGAAKAKFFPTFNITAMIGSKSTDVSDLFDPLSTASSITGSITQPILDFGQRSANYTSKKARKQQAVIAYRQTLRQAFKGVSDALTEVKYTKQRLQSVRSELQKYRDTLQLARTRYKAGQTNFFNVLDAQRNVYSTQLDLATSIRNRFTAIANLYKAIGGGWTHSSDSLTPAMEDTMREYDQRARDASDGKASADNASAD